MEIAAPAFADRQPVWLLNRSTGGKRATAVNKRLYDLDYYEGWVYELAGVAGLWPEIDLSPRD